MKNINLEFGGFYSSIHDENVNSMLDQYYSDEEGQFLDYSYLNIDYRAIYNEYIKDYCHMLTQYMSDEYSIDVKFKNLSLISPREYNFSTDKINVNITNLANKNINKLFLKNSTFLEYLKNATKSYDGYMSFYSYNEALENKDDMLIEYIFTFICNEFNTDKFYSYYDNNNLYELLYCGHLNMPELK